MVEIRVGYELIYDCPQPTPMMLVLNIHYTRAADILVPDQLKTDPPVPIAAYRDSFGNWCSRIVAPKGQIRIASTAVVKDSGEPDVVATSAQQHSIQDLPEEALFFSLGEPILRYRKVFPDRLELVRSNAAGLGSGPGDLRFRAQPHLIRL
jgi:transglutaminase-like putative cysteine protease